jgi:hypothetical protein
MELAGKFRPAFERQNNTFVPTQQWQDVQAVMQRNTNIPINVQAAPSVLADITGMGMWGSGGGIHFPDTGQTYVDPISGSVTVAAHEAAHQAFPSSLIHDQTAQQKGFNDLYSVGRDQVADGTAMRVGYEALSKPIMLEEANAQGVATAAMNAIGLKPDTNGWQNMLSYPSEYRFGGRYDRAAPLYKESFNKPGIATFLPGELNTFNTILKSSPYAMQRQFNKGYGRIK